MARSTADSSASLPPTVKVNAAALRGIACEWCTKHQARHLTRSHGPICNTCIWSKQDEERRGIANCFQIRAASKTQRQTVRRNNAPLLAELRQRQREAINARALHRLLQP
jgi:hypothetical protein